MERTVKVNVQFLVNGAIGQLGRLRQATRDFSSELQKTAVDRKATFNDIAFGLGALGVAIGGVTAIAVKKFADFDQAMSHVEAVTRETAHGMELLRDAALEAGARTVFTALEAAQAIEELAKAGVRTEDILSGGLAGALNLAAASGLSVARAAEIAAGALGMFKLAGADIPHVADMLAAGANKSIGEVDDLALALRQVGPVANQVGLSIEETIGALAAFASTGRIGLDAGTSFKRMLQLLTPQSALAKAEMEKLGIAGYDASGHFIGLAKFAGVLQTQLKDLTPEARNAAFATMFGSDAVNAATEVYRQGAEGIQEWIDKVDDQGYAMENAKLRLGNLKGDLEQFRGSIDVLFVNMGEAANGPLRSLVQGATGLVNALSSTSDSFQQFLFWVGAAGSAITVFGGIMFFGIPKIAAYKQAVDLLTLSFPKLGAAIGVAGKALGWAGVALVAITALVTITENYNASLRATGAQLQNTIKVASDGANILKSVLQNMTFDDPGMEDNLEGWKNFAGQAWKTADAVKNFQYILDETAQHERNAARSIFDSKWEAAGGTYGEVAQRLRDLGQSYADLSSTDLPAAQNGFRLLFEETDGTKESFNDLLDLMPAYKEALVAMATTAGYDATNAQVMMNLAMGEGAEGAEAQRHQLEEMSAAAADASGEIGDLATMISEFGKATFEFRDTQRDVGKSFRDLADAIKTAREEGATNADMLDLNTAAGYEVTGAMDDTAAAINAAAAAMYNQSGSVEELNAYLDAQREALFKVGMELYGNTDLAWAYVDSLVAAPEEIITNVKLTGLDVSQAELDKWYAKNNNRILNINARANMPQTTPGVPNPGGYASGGTVRGPGTSISDSVLTWLSSGEEVINAKQAALYRPLLKAINAGAKIPRLAGGGTADRQYATSTGSSYAPVPVSVQSGDQVHLSVPLVPDRGVPLADQLFSASRRLQVRLKARRS